MSGIHSDSSIGRPVRPFGLRRSWLRTLVLTELVMAATFTACTVWLAVSSPTESPLVTPVVRRVFTWYSVKYSAWVFLGYMIIGLVLSTAVWGVLASWAYLRNRPLTRRGLTVRVIVALAAILAYELIALSVLDPQVVGNTFTGVSGVRLIGALGDHVPAWLVLGVRYGVASLAALLVLTAAGRALVRARRSTRIAALAVIAVALVAVAGVGLRLALQKPPPSQRDPRRPNILILASDGLQKEHLSLYGYHRPTSPHIDALGRDAVRFDQCYVPVARTLGSWASILTSTYPHTHNFRQTWPRETHLELAQPTLCRELKKLGYSSYVFSDWAGSDFGKATLVWTVLFFGVQVAGPFFGLYMLSQVPAGLGLGERDTIILYVILSQLSSVVRLIAWPTAGRLVDRFGAAPMLRHAILGAATVAMLWGLLPGFWLLIPVEIFSGLVWCVAETAFSVILFNCHDDPRIRARLVGMHQAMVASSQAAGAWVGGAIIGWAPDFLGSHYRFMFILSTILRMPAVILAFWILPRVSLRRAAAALLPTSAVAAVSASRSAHETVAISRRTEA